MTKHSTRKERLQKRRDILRRNRAIAPDCVLSGFLIGLAFGYWWAAQAYARPQPAAFSLGPAVVHHAPNQLPTVPATGEETGL